LLGPLDALLKQEAERREAEARENGLLGRFARGLSQTFKRTSSSATIKKVSGDAGAQFHMDELLQIRVLGAGRFGKVKLVQHGANNMAYALKILHKQVLDDLNADKAVFVECNLLRTLEYPFLPALYGTFQDVMERRGYLKIIDFGSTKKVVPPTTTNTICGTPEYMAPEMISARGHGRAVDYWALGVFLFEMLTGHSPFEQNDVSAVYQRIMCSSESLQECFSHFSHFDPVAKDLILKLLVDMPGLRVGMLRNGVEDIWRHPFLS
ncbi:Pka-C3, partial [Symbiodinium microadriaticum]